MIGAVTQNSLTHVDTYLQPPPFDRARERVVRWSRRLARDAVDDVGVEDGLAGTIHTPPLLACASAIFIVST